VIHDKRQRLTDGEFHDPCIVTPANAVLSDKTAFYLVDHDSVGSRQIPATTECATRSSRVESPRRQDNGEVRRSEQSSMTMDGATVCSHPGWPGRGATAAPCAARRARRSDTRGYAGGVLDRRRAQRLNHSGYSCTRAGWPILLCRRKTLKSDVAVSSSGRPIQRPG
jgi:hypothetical protein